MNDPRDDREGDTARGGSPSRREAARTTIVGGQPDGNTRDLPPIPVGLEHLMGLAAASPEFAEALGRDRRAALAASGLELSLSERGILEAVPTPALNQMVTRVGARLDTPDRRRFFEQAGLALVVLLGASTAAGCKKKPAPEPGGKEGDPPARDQPGAPEGDRPSQERGTDMDHPATARQDASAATPDAAAARPAEPAPLRPATPQAMDMDADVVDMAAMAPPGTPVPGMPVPGMDHPASVAPLRIRPDEPPPSKGAQPWRPRPRDMEPVKTRGISPDRRFKGDDL